MKAKLLVLTLVFMGCFFGIARAQRATLTPEYSLTVPTSCNSNVKRGLLVFVKDDGLYKCVNNTVVKAEGVVTSGGGGAGGSNARSKDIQVYTSLSAAQTDISTGGASAGSLLTISTATNCSSVLNFANPTSLEFTGTGKIVWQSGCDLTITGKIIAANIQIFSGFTKENIHLAADVDKYYPEWFGAKGDGATDDFQPIQLLFDAVKYPNLTAGATHSFVGGKVEFGRKNYRITKEIRVSRPFEINGAGGSYREKPLTVISKPSGIRGFVFQDFAAGEQFGAYTTAGSSNVTALDSRFSAPSDVGKAIIIYGAGVPNPTPDQYGRTATNLQATITAVTDPTHITLSQPAGATVSDNGIFTAYTGYNLSTAKGSILRGIGIVSSGGEADNLVITTVGGSTANDGTKFGRMVISSWSGTGKQLYTADTSNEIGKTARTIPEGTIVSIGATHWRLLYTTLSGSDAVPYLRTRYRVSAAANSNLITSGTQNFESWMIGAKLKIRGRYYLIGGVPAANSATLTYAPQGAYEPPPLGTAGTNALLPQLVSETIEVVALPTNSTPRPAHIYLNHAVDAQVSMTIENCYFYGAYGDSIHLDSFITTGGAETNLNYSRIIHNSSYEAQGSGIHTRGKNTNAVSVNENDVENSKGWGFYEGSILGNGYMGNHASGNIFGAYFSDPEIPTNQSSFYSNYAEGDEGGDNVLSSQSEWHGGTAGNFFSEIENKAPVLLGSLGSKTFALDGGLRATNKRPFSSDGSGLGYYDRQVQIAAQLGSHDQRPTLFGFGASDDGANRFGENGTGAYGGTDPNYSWVYSKTGLTPGWYAFGYQLGGDVTQINQVSMAVSGSNTLAGTNAALTYTGAYRTWFPNAIRFGQSYTSGNGKTGYEPRFTLDTDASGLTLGSGSFQATGFKNTPITLANRPACIAGNVGLEVVILGSTTVADAKQICLGNAVDPRTYSWKTITTN